jgi:integrase/recombinase XerD
MVASAARRAGIEGKRVSPHVLRHTYATTLLREGFTIREVQELLGHASVATTQIYTHVDPQALREKVQGRRETEAEKIAKALLEHLPPAVRAALREVLKE